MARRLITFILRVIARMFFRKIEIVGDVPVGVPVIFAVNHPNALIDPLFLLCFAPRRVSFLAKAPLLKMPVIGWIARSLDSIPVYRKQDNADTASNRETFDRARAVLEHGGAIAIFPEGTTHSDPKLRELKTGVSRIALGASLRVLIVPTGLYYTSKHTFRSAALVYFGEPIEVLPQPDDPPVVNALTQRIEDALAEVTLQADSHDALDLITRAERIFSAASGPRSLADELELRKRFIAGYRYLCDHDPARLARIEAEIRDVEMPEHVGRARVSRLLLVIPGIVGAIVHWPVYTLIDLIARRADREMAATVKFIGGALFYPLWWIAIAFFTRWWALLVLPLLAYCAVIGRETWDAFTTRLPNVEHLRAEIEELATPPSTAG